MPTVYSQDPSGMLALCIDAYCVLTGLQSHVGPVVLMPSVCSKDPSGMLALCIDAHCVLTGPESHVCAVFVIHSTWLR